MFFALKIKESIIEADDRKEAFLKGLKEYSKYMASPKYSNVTFSIKKVPSSNNTYVFTTYTNIDAKAFQKEFCKTCKYFHTSFYVNEEYNCNRCNLKSYLKQIEKASKISRNYYKRKMDE